MNKFLQTIACACLLNTAHSTVALTSSYFQYRSDTLASIAKPLLNFLVKPIEGITRVEVNAPCDPLDCISVILLDYRATRIGVAALRPFANNAAYVGENVVIFDELLFLEHLVLAFTSEPGEGNAVVHLRQQYPEVVEQFPAVLSNPVLVGLVDYFRSVMYRDLQGIDGSTESAKMFDAYAGWVDELRRTLESTEFAAASAEKQAELLSRTVGIAFIFYHEVGHLMQGQQGSFDFSEILYFFANWGGLADRRALEMQADEYAAELFARLWSSDPSGGTQQSFKWLAGDMQRLFHYRLLDGFRGRSFLDNTYSLLHRPCEDFVTQAPPPGRQLNTTGIVGYVIRVIKRPIPLMTDREFRQLSQRALQMLRGTHANPIQRLGILSAKIAKDVLLPVDDSAITEVMDKETRFLQALADSKPELAVPNVTEGVPLDGSAEEMLEAIQRTASSVLNSIDLDGSPLSYTARLDKAVNCPNRYCSVISIQDNSGTALGDIEVVEDANSRVTGFQAYLHMPQASFDQGDDYFRRMLAQRLYLIKSLEKILPLSGDDISAALHEVVLMRAQCGGSGVSIEFPSGGFLDITVGGDPDWYRLMLR